MSHTHILITGWLEGREEAESLTVLCGSILCISRRGDGWDAPEGYTHWIMWAGLHGPVVFLTEREARRVSELLRGVIDP